MTKLYMYPVYLLEIVNAIILGFDILFGSATTRACNLVIFSNQDS